MSVEKMTSKTKTGKEIQVAIIPAEMIDGRYEGLVFTGRAADASKVAIENGCTHYRVMLGGRAVMSGKANSDAYHGSWGPQG